ncbi:MAG: PPOX class F420-dependent oxidoreductase [Gaiellaceae bacterium]
MTTLTDKQVALLTSGKDFGVVATLGNDGRPQTSVVWVDWDGENVLLNTTNARAKGRNLRTDPRVSISVWNHADPYAYFEVEGAATLDEKGAAEHIHELSRRYKGEDFHAPTDRVIVRIRPERVLDHGVNA